MNKRARVHNNFKSEYLLFKRKVDDPGIVMKEFLEEYFILIGNSMYGNLEESLLWLILLDKYLIKECNMTRSKAYSYIFYNKDEDGKL